MSLATVFSSAKGALEAPASAVLPAQEESPKPTENRGLAAMAGSTLSSAATSSPISSPSAKQTFPELEIYVKRHQQFRANRLCADLADKEEAMRSLIVNCPSAAASCSEALLLQILTRVDLKNADGLSPYIKAKVQEFSAISKSSLVSLLRFSRRMEREVVDATYDWIVAWLELNDCQNAKELYSSHHPYKFLKEVHNLLKQLEQDRVRNDEGIGPESLGWEALQILEPVIEGLKIDKATANHVTYLIMKAAEQYLEAKGKVTLL